MRPLSAVTRFNEQMAARLAAAGIAPGSAV